MLLKVASIIMIVGDGLGIVFGIIAVSSVFASTLSMMGGNSLNFASLLVGLLLPVLYLVGAFQNKKLAY